MPDGVIPPSPYPVLKDTRQPTRVISGPYIASRPAYQMFAEQARTGASISDMIAADMRAQAKSEGRPDPVKEMPENRGFWFHDGEMEPIPAWPTAGEGPKSAPAAPAAPAGGAGAAVLPAPAAPVPVAPAPAAPAAPDADRPATAGVASVGSGRRASTSRPVGGGPVTSAKQRQAAASYGRTVARRDTRAV